VKSVAIAAKDLKLKFAKEKDAGGDERWKMIEPSAAPAEGSKSIEMLDKLDNLQARGPDVSDPADRKPFGFADDDATTTVTLGFGDDAKPLVYRLGKDDPAKSRIYVQVAGRPRVNAVPDDLRKMVERPALAYRSRRVLDMPARTVTRITVDRPADSYALTQSDSIWSLAVPVATKADTGKANSLAADLARLEAADFVNFNPTPEDLKNYGLDAPTLKVTVAGEGSKTVLFGKPREGKPEIYAKLADAGEVFALRSGVKDAVNQPSLAFRPLQLWAAPGAIVSRIGIDRDSKKYDLTRDGAIWKIGGPFAANAFLPSVQSILEVASAPRAEKFVAHTDADLATYGLDKPAGTLTVTLTPERPEDPAGTRTLIFGKNVTDGQAPRYARLDGLPGVFVLPAGDVVDKTALDLLDRRMLQIDTRQIIRLGGVGPTGTWSAKRDGASWTLDSFNPPVPGDRATLERLAGVLADIRASQFAAYGTADLATFGLDKPTNTFEITLGTGDKPTKHVIALGVPVPGNPQARFARVDDGPAIAQLNPLLSMELGVSPLELADRVLFNFTGRDLTAITRTIGPDELRIERKDGAWQIIKPAAVPADEPALAELAERVGALRAVKVAALGVKDFRQYGLEPPAASFRFTVTELGAAPRELTLALGNLPPQGRPARIGNIATVYLIPDSAGDPLAARLTAAPLKFRDRTLARFNDADRITIKRGERTVTFAKVDGLWKMTVPVAADAEAFDLEDLVLLASKLRCEELLADTKGDLKPFGLEKPEATVTFFLGDKEVEKFAVSAKDAEGRVIVRVGESPMVGRLDLALSTRLLNEFRKRALWTNLDVAQVETLILNAGAGGTPAVFNKTDTGWQVAGDADRVVNIEAITDLLATFAALKAERYVADQKPELKLYGLEPPVRVIIVKTRTGNPTTLHLGRFEGESKRAYAAVPGAGTVVVLSEADSAKLLKPAGELSRK
ncbi:MAG: DUF4340 domain-containing protein, partial [Gemmataceae bacterium]|nr:DUF4340 domain-containing protein [Gemmataceae bacterium]